MIRDGAVRAGRLRGVEGVRAIAATSIVVYHAWLYGGPGGREVPLGLAATHVLPHLALGVTVFFTLSGFLLYRPFAAAIIEGSVFPSVRSYLRNRALRILPAYWVALLVVSLALGAAILPNTAPGLRTGFLTDDPQRLLLALLFLQGSSPTTLYMGIGPAWSLSVEVLFYLALPLLAIGTYRIVAARGRHRLAAVVPPLILLGIGLSGKLLGGLWVSQAPIGGGDISWRDVVIASFWGQADLFAAGMLLAVVHARVAHRGLPLSTRQQMAIAGLALLLAGPAVVLWYADGLPRYLYQTLMSISAALLLAIVVLPAASRSPGSRVVWLLETRVVVALGLVSYSLFLWHEPIVHLLGPTSLMARDWAGLLRNVLIVGVPSVLIAGASYLLVERPALQRKGSPRTVIDGGPARDRQDVMPADQAEAAP